MSSVKETVLDFGNMFRAAKKSFKSLRWKSSTVKYEDNELGNILKLIEEIESGTYEISPYVEFTIYEPKQRNIVATCTGRYVSYYTIFSLQSIIITIQLLSSLFRNLASVIEGIDVAPGSRRR